jgi:CBS domain-containing protein
LLKKEGTVRVKDAMTRSAISISPKADVSEALDVMIRSRLSGLPVVDETGSLVGIVSESDFLRRWELGTESSPIHWLEEFILPGMVAEIYTRAHSRRVEDIMSKEVATVDEDASLSDAVGLMEKRRVKRLPVVKEGKVVGMISRADFVRALALFIRQPRDEAVISDVEIKERIESEMRAQTWAPVATVSVTVKDGVVTLNGTLIHWRQRDAIHALVENVQGVREIHDHTECAEAPPAW